MARLGAPRGGEPSGAGEGSLPLCHTDRLPWDVAIEQRVTAATRVSHRTPNGPTGGSAPG